MTTIEAMQDRLETALQRAGRADDRELSARIREEGHRLVFLLNGLVRATRLYDANNEALDSPAAELSEVVASLLASLGVVHVVLVEDQVYVNDVRLRIRPPEQPVVDQLMADLGRHNAGGLSFHQALPAASWKEVARAIGSPPEGPQPLNVLAAHLRKIGDTEISGRWRFHVGEGTRPGSKPHAEVLGRAEAALVEALARLAAGRMPSPLPVRRAVIDLVESVQESPMRAATAPFTAPSSLGASERHLLSVCELSLMLGQALGLSRATLSDLGVAAMLHDVGYLRPTTRESHPVAGTRLLLRQRGFSEAKIRRLLAVLEHSTDYIDMSHDEESPSLFARILRVAEDYDLLTAPRAGHVAMSPAEALGILWAGRGDKYDPILVAQFAQVLGRYPAGTLLELTEGSWAVVVGGGRDRERFSHPVLRVVRAADGGRFAVDDEVDLFAQRALVGIRSVVDPTRVAPEVEASARHALAQAAS